MEINSAFNLIESLEAKMSAMYDKLSKSFENDTEARDFFLKLKSDELSHVEMARTQKRIVSADPASFPSDIAIDLKEMNEIIDTIHHVLNSSLSIDEALEKVFKLESTTAELYVVTALKKSGKELDRFLFQLGDSLREHSAYITDFMKTRAEPVMEKGQLKEIRVPYRTNVTVNGSIQAMAQDLSEYGVFLRKGSSFKAGSLVTLDMPVMDEVLNVQARVEVEGEDTKLGFAGLDEHARSLLRKFMDSCLEKADDEVSKAEKVLLVNNPKYNEKELGMYGGVFSDAGFAVVEVMSLAEAAALLDKEQNIKIIVISIETEEDDTFKLLSFIGKHPGCTGIPVFVVSTNYDLGFKRAVMAAGAVKLLYRMSATPDKLWEAAREFV